MDGWVCCLLWIHYYSWHRHFVEFVDNIKQIIVTTYKCTDYRRESMNLCILTNIHFYLKPWKLVSKNLKEFSVFAIIFTWNDLPSTCVGFFGLVGHFQQFFSNMHHAYQTYWSKACSYITNRPVKHPV